MVLTINRIPLMAREKFQGTRP
uniref:Uncharacterized protein n=1 Tax=Arundo donax TaxID=35708 RepID=A0A0A8Z5P2_ARUDO